MREREPQTIIFDMSTISIDPQEIYDLELDKIAPVILCYKRGVPTPESAKKLPEDLRETFEVKKSSTSHDKLLNSQDGACLVRGQVEWEDAVHGKQGQLGKRRLVYFTQSGLGDDLADATELEATQVLNTSEKIECCKHFHGVIWLNRTPRDLQTS